MFDVDILKCRDRPYLAASPDAIDLLGYPEFDKNFEWAKYRPIDFNGKRHAMEVVDIKTVVSVWSLGSVLGKSEAEICCM